MMHADLIDEQDLVGQLRSLGFEVSGTAEQACSALPDTSNPKARSWPSRSCSSIKSACIMTVYPSTKRDRSLILVGLWPVGKGGSVICLICLRTGRFKAQARQSLDPYGQVSADHVAGVLSPATAQACVR